MIYFMMFGWLDGMQRVPIWLMWLGLRIRVRVRVWNILCLDQILSCGTCESMVLKLIYVEPFGCDPRTVTK